MTKDAIAHQVLVALEAIPGNPSNAPGEAWAVTPGAADAVLAFAPSYTPEGSTEPAAALALTLSPIATMPGGLRERVRFDVHLRGSGLLDLEPRVGRLFRASGMRATRVSRLHLQAATPQTVGAILEGVTSGALARLVLANTSAVLAVERLNAIGFAAGESLRVNGAGSSLAVAASGTLEQRTGWIYRPSSARIATVQLDTGSAWVGGLPASGTVLQGVTSGAIGTVKAPRTAGGYPVMIPPAFSTGGTPAAPTQATTSESVLYYEPAVGRFLTGEGLRRLSDGVVAKLTHPSNVGHATFSGHSATIRSTIDGVRRGMRGARATWSLNIEPGRDVRVSFSFLGAFDANDDAAPVAVTTYGDIAPFLDFLGWECGLGVPISSIRIDANVELTSRSSGSSADGFDSAEVSGRDLAITVQPELESVLAADWVAAKRSGLASTPLVFDSRGGDGQRFAFWAPAAQVVDEQDLKLEDIASKALRFRARRAASYGDDDFALVFD